MYEEFYKFTGRPFQLTPDPRFYFNTRTHRKAMAYLKYGLNQEEGFIIITGDIGAGKTTLVGHLFNELNSDEYVFAKVVTTQVNADDLLRMVASAFGIDADDMSKASLIQHIETFLRAQYRVGKRVLLIVDEAQNLPISALEELRMLSNFTSENKALLQSFLLGQPEFRDQLATSPALEQLRQRVIATHHLEPMIREEVDGYIEHRLKMVGWSGNPEFTNDAYDAIFDYSAGVPRRLNTLCSRILLFGGLEELTRIDRGVVENVVADLEKDRTPTTGPKVGGSAEPGPTNGFRKGDKAQGKTDTGVATLGKDLGRDLGSELGSEIMLEDLDRRLETLERYMRAHDRTIRKMVNVIADWVENSEDTDHG